MRSNAARARAPSAANLTLVPSARRVWTQIGNGRVSPTGKDDTMELQVAAITEAAAKRTPPEGFDSVGLLEIIEDDMVTGMLDIADRPGGRRIVNMVCPDGNVRCRGKRSGCRLSPTRPDEIVFSKQDRLGRTAFGQLEVMRFLTEHEVVLNILNTNIDTGTIMGRAAFGMFAVMAETDREMILERTMNGKNKSKAEGKWWGGRVPFGLALDENHWLSPADDAATVVEIFERVAHEGATTGSEARRTGVTQRVIQRLLHNEVYVRPLGPGGSIPALISQELFDAAEAALTGNQKNAKRNRQHDYLLSGILQCAHCPRTYVGRTQDSGPDRADGFHREPRVYYYCTTRADTGRGGTDRTCIGMPINGLLAEQQMWAKVQESILNPGALLAEAKRVEAKEDRTGALEAELASVVAALAKLAAKREAINESIDERRRTKEEGTAALAKADADAGPLDRQRADLELQLRAARDAKAATLKAQIQPVDIAKKIAKINATNDRARMQEMIKAAVERAEVVTHLNRKRPFIELLLRIAPDAPLRVGLPSSRRGDDYQQALISVTLTP